MYGEKIVEYLLSMCVKCIVFLWLNESYILGRKEVICIFMIFMKFIFFFFDCKIECVFKVYCREFWKSVLYVLFEIMKFFICIY